MVGFSEEYEERRNRMQRAARVFVGVAIKKLLSIAGSASAAAGGMKSWGQAIKTVYPQPKCASPLDVYLDPPESFQSGGLIGPPAGIPAMCDVPVLHAHDPRKHMPVFQIVTHIASAPPADRLVRFVRAGVLLPISYYEASGFPIPSLWRAPLYSLTPPAKEWA